MGISIPHLTVVLVIVVLVFGTKHIKTLGGDLGSALKSFRKAINEEEDLAPTKAMQTIDASKQAEIN